MKVVALTNINTAIRIFYEYPELGNPQIRELFGDIAGATISKYKKAVLKVQIEKGVKTMSWNTVNTEIAYEVWGIDVEDLIKRREKLKKLGFSA